MVAPKEKGLPIASLTRRDFLRSAAGVGLWGLAGPAQGADRSKSEGVGVLVDLTRCIGCRACVRACQRANGLPESLKSGEMARQDNREEPAFDRWTVVNREGVTPVKRQCLHCLEPACTSVCPVGALHQTEDGPVVYRADRCIGCRYCMVACPFGVPKFDWGSGLTPVIGKCQFCHQERLSNGLPPACAEACPTGALKFGRRDRLLFEAKARIHARPEHYVDRVYGEKEAGGTSWLYLSGRPFQEAGFPAGVPEEPLPSLTWVVISKIPYLVTAMAVVLGMVASALKKEKG